MKLTYTGDNWEDGSRTVVQIVTTTAYLFDTCGWPLLYLIINIIGSHMLLQCVTSNRFL